MRSAFLYVKPNHALVNILRVRVFFVQYGRELFERQAFPSFWMRYTAKGGKERDPLNQLNDFKALRKMRSACFYVEPNALPRNNFARKGVFLLYESGSILFCFFTLLRTHGEF